jgi:hypothetical protein
VRVVIALVVVVAVQVLIRIDAVLPLTFAPAARMLVHSAAHPAVFAVAHVAWAGPLLLLAGLCWRQVAAVVREGGTGLVAVFALMVVDSIDPQTRNHLWMLPLLGACTLMALERARALDRQLLLFLAASSLVASRVWLRLDLAAQPVDGPLADQARQAYFMAHGLFMAPDGYALQGALLLQATFLLHLLLARLRRPRSTRT